MNLSGRGDKDVAQMMEILAPMTGVVESGRWRRRCARSRDAGRKLLVPYITGGLAGWQDAVRAAAAAGADAIEIGIPFSDPVMDGPVIQEASQRALDGGRHAGRRSSTSSRDLDAGVPLAVMTYYNIVFHAGHERFAAATASRPASPRRIVPDLPLEEVGPWCAAADAAGVETVHARRADRARRAPAAHLRPRPAASSTASACSASPASATQLAATAASLARRLKAITDVPVLVGVGVSNAEQAREAVQVADGVVRARRSCAGCSTAARTRSATTSPRSAAAIDDERRRDRVEPTATCARRRGSPPWFHEDELCWIAECEICAVPMVVWKAHDPDPPDDVKADARTPGWPRWSTSTSSSSTTSTTTCATSPTTTTPTPGPVAASSATG